MNVVTVAEVNKSFLCGDVKRGFESGKNEVFRASLNSVSQCLASPWKWFAGKVGNLSAKSQSRGPQALAVYYSSNIASATICHRLDSSSDLVFSFPRYSILEENEIPEVDFKSDRHLQRELGSAPREATVANDLPTSRHSSIYMHADGEFA